MGQFRLLGLITRDRGGSRLEIRTQEEFDILQKAGIHGDSETVGQQAERGKQSARRFTGVFFYCHV